MMHCMWFSSLFMNFLILISYDSLNKTFPSFREPKRMNHLCFSCVMNWMLLLLILLIRIQHVDSGSVVKYLPGFEGPLPFELETGYVGVGEAEEVQLFYYFIKSERNPREDPLMVWLTGGPGCTSLSGLAYEIGPVTFKVEEYNGSLPKLVSTTYSWTKVASIIFLDQPVGSGFSYARTPLANHPSDTKEAEYVNQFLRKWLVDHREFLSNPFYVGGDSYSGIVIPPTVQEISLGNENGTEPHINLQGYVLGNPFTDPRVDLNSRIPFAHGMGLISDELYESLKRACGRDYVDVNPNNLECLGCMKHYRKCISGINKALILSPSCNVSVPKLSYSESPRRRYLEEFLDADLSDPHSRCYKYRLTLSIYWANDKNVRKALHVAKGSIGKWVRCNWGLPYTNDIKSSIPYHMNNSIKGYRSLIYSGDHDIRIPFLGTQAWIRSLNFSIVDHWRPWIINNQVAGYTRSYANNMTFATIKGGGHTAEFTPEECFVMFQRWISFKPL